MTIYEFSDYRLFLRSFIKDLPKAGRGQVNKLASHLGVNSTLISQVLSGRKDFTLEQAQLVAEYLGLANIESDYFLLLVQIERAGTKKLKDYFRLKMKAAREASLDIKNRIPAQRALSDQERAVFYSSWLYSAIRLFCSIGAGKSVDEICDRFSQERSKVLEIMEFLVSVGLCKQEGVLYQMGSQKTHLEQGSPFLARHYSNWRIKAIQRSENLQKQEMMFTAPFSVSRKDFEILREHFVEAIQKIYKQVEDSDPDDVACVNIDLFWVK